MGQDKGAELAKKLNRERHRVVGKVTEDIERNSFNTAISAIMELVNAAAEYLRGIDAATRKGCDKLSALDADIATTIVKLLAPVAPHMTDELWATALGQEGSVHVAPWPEFDPDQAKDDEVELAVQVNGKVRAKITVAADAPSDQVEEVAKQAVASLIEGKDLKKVVVVPGRLVNIVAK